MLVYIIFPVFHLRSLYKNYVWIHTFHCPNEKLLVAVDFEHDIVFSSIFYFHLLDVDFIIEWEDQETPNIEQIILFQQPTC